MIDEHDACVAFAVGHEARTGEVAVDSDAARDGRSRVRVGRGINSAVEIGVGELSLDAGDDDIARLAYPNRVFRDVEKALAWLEVDPDEGLAILTELEAIRGHARGQHSIVGRLQNELEIVGPIALGATAPRLSVSTRTLQRALRDAGTTYRMELEAFRIRRAQELLRGERALEWIAAEVGFSSAQNFSTAFRRVVGEAPSAWRARNTARE